MLAVFSIVTAVVCGMIPALLTVNSSALQALQHGGIHSSADRRQKHVRDGLIVVEIALSLTLLVACGLLLRTLYALRHEPLGIRTDHVLTADFNIPGYQYHNTNLVTQLYEPLLDKNSATAGCSGRQPIDHRFRWMRVYWVQLSMYGRWQEAIFRHAMLDKLINAQLNGSDSRTCSVCLVFECCREDFSTIEGHI